MPWWKKFAATYFRMIFCNFCDRAFYDGELITIRNVAGTELMYHHGCWIQYADNNRKLAEIFGETFDQDSMVPEQFFCRVFRTHQIAPKTLTE
jgi:hypothetical protein